MYRKTLTELADDLANKKISSTELTELFLKQIENNSAPLQNNNSPSYKSDETNDSLNAFITITKDEAVNSAKMADQLRAEGKAQKLTGIPIAHKDIFCTLGVKTSCGSKILDNFIAPYDATAVENFKNVGMVMLGKTNMDEFAMGSSNENSFYGPVKNPWNLDAVPGGSSGGSAAAVAACLTPAATGTDTGGSIRQPAALCGITGLKPTYGRVSRYGMVAFASSLDQGGVFARTAEDCAHLINIMASFDPKDSTSVNKEVPDYSSTLAQPMTGLKIGIPKEYFSEGLDDKVAKTIQAAIKEFEKLGAEIKNITLPHSELSVPAYHNTTLDFSTETCRAGTFV